MLENFIFEIFYYDSFISFYKMSILIYKEFFFNTNQTWFYVKSRQASGQ